MIGTSALKELKLILFQHQKTPRVEHSILKQKQALQKLIMVKTPSWDGGTSIKVSV